MRRDPSVAEQERRLRHQERCSESRFYSMQDAARTLGLSRWRVWQLAVSGELAYEPTVGGQFMFHRQDLQSYRDDRAERLARTRAQHLRVLRLQMVKATIEPRQIEFGFMTSPKPRLRLVESADPGERSLYDRRTKSAESFDRARESDTWRSVNRKAGGGR